MKILLTVLFVLFSTASAFCQENVKEISAAEFKEASTPKSEETQKAEAAKAKAAGEPVPDVPIENRINKAIDFGVSLGFNTIFEKIYEARISPLDNKLKVTDAPTAAFLLSTGVSFPISNGYFGGRYYRKLDSSGRATGDAYYVPYGICAVATVNLITFNSAASGSLFNQKLDGGLGLGYRINDNVQVTATVEMISYRLPREFLVNDYKDKILKDVAGTTITTINLDDNNYYIDRYMPSVSIKLFYLIAYKPKN